MKQIETTRREERRAQNQRAWELRLKEPDAGERRKLESDRAGPAFNGLRPI